MTSYRDFMTYSPLEIYTFWRKSEQGKIDSPLRMEALFSFETPVNFYQIMYVAFQNLFFLKMDSFCFLFFKFYIFSTMEQRSLTTKNVKLANYVPI
jgi:hypothetical protein